MEETQPVVSVASQKTISYVQGKLHIITFLQHEYASYHFEATSSRESPPGPGLFFLFLSGSLLLKIIFVNKLRSNILSSCLNVLEGDTTFDKGAAEVTNLFSIKFGFHKKNTCSK